ncbi:uncharacterized protein RCC_09452 [Ramularia collo-cygni]|uniref:IBR domain-containing protein n=1 Tax=Ramularia collo-cygni TaxID=112498 RepID=A0A2D3VPA5_9PEZI|nr:uncharacterized protein RCC_09452 [Ramularia collo-cygni]CZT23738.1 uncharacterized protein RCC_09452 [Ramularia collo-cygni]
MDMQTWQLEDEVDAINLQLGYLHLYDEEKKGKYSPSNIPDPEVAYDDFRTYLQLRLQSLQDFKLARSIAHAVSADAPIIAELIEAERVAHQDRQLAFRMSNEEPDLEAPPPYTEIGDEAAILDDSITRLGLQDEEPVDAGPSGYVRGQVETLEKLASKSFQCSACTEHFRLTETSELPCGDRYCGDCLKDFIMRPVREHDFTLLPARCCRLPVPQGVVATVLNEQEYQAYQSTEEEAATRDKTYCSSAECGQFVSPKYIVADTATCPRCRVGTCIICKNTGHEGDCPADPALQATLALGNEHNWQRCFSCRAMVAIEWGCNHMRQVRSQKLQAAYRTLTLTYKGAAAQQSSAINVALNGNNVAAKYGTKRTLSSGRRKLLPELLRPTLRLSNVNAASSRSKISSATPMNVNTLASSRRLPTERDFVAIGAMTGIRSSSSSAAIVIWNCAMIVAHTVSETDGVSIRFH